MYEDFVKRLRDRAGALDYDGWVETACDYDKAADVIEELSAKLSAYEQTGVKPEEIDPLARILCKLRCMLGIIDLAELDTFVDICMRSVEGKNVSKLPNSVVAQWSPFGAAIKTFYNASLAENNHA